MWWRGFPAGSAVKNPPAKAGDAGLITVSGRSPEEGNGNPLHYSGLENCMDWTVHGITKSRTQLSDLHFHFKDHLVNNVFFICISITDLVDLFGE